MTNPLSGWAQISNDDQYKSLAPEEQEKVRQDFVSHNSGGDAQVAKFFNYATTPLEKTFDTEDFHKMDKKAQFEVIKANKLASGQLTEDDFKGDNFFNHGNRAVLHAYDSYVAPAIGESLLSPVYGAAQTAGYIGKEVLGTEGKTLAAANESIRGMKKMQERAPTSSAVAEIGSQVATGLATAGGAGIKGAGWLANRAINAAGVGATTALTSPEQVNAGTSDQEAEQVSRAKQRDFLLGAGTAGLVDAATSKTAVNALGDAKRWLGRSVDAKIADNADDLLREAAKADAERVAIDNAKGGTATKMTPQQLKSSISAERQAVAGNTQDFVNTGEAAGADSALGKLQLGTKGSNPEEIIKEGLEKPSLPFAKAWEQTNTSMVPGEASTYVLKNAKPGAYADATKAMQENVGAIEAGTKQSQQELWDAARQTGVLGAKAPVTVKQYAAQLQYALKGVDAKGQKDLLSIFTRPTSVDKTLKLDDIVLDKMDLLAAKTPQNAKYIDKLVKVQDDLLGATALPKVQEVFAKSQQLELDAAQQIANVKANIGIDKAVETQFAKEPLKKAFAANTGAKSVTDAFLDSNTSHAQIADAIHDPVLGKNLKAAVASDITDTLNTVNNKTSQLELQNLAERYAGRRKEVLTLFEDQPQLQHAFTQLMDAGEAAGSIRKGFLTKGAEQAGKGGSYAAKAAGGELLGVRTGALGLLDGLKESFNKGTRDLLRASWTDKQLADKIFSKAEDIQAARVKYSDMWDKFQGVRKAALATGQGIDATSSDTKVKNRPLFNSKVNNTPLPEVNLPKMDTVPVSE